MYVCMYVCMCVCTYACMHAFMYVFVLSYATCYMVKLFYIVLQHLMVSHDSKKWFVQFFGLNAISWWIMIFLQ